MVVMIGDRAYKAKKPVRTAFLDFSTPERRTDALRRELELNRRISPDVYLGLGAFSGPDRPVAAQRIHTRAATPSDATAAIAVATAAIAVAMAAAADPWPDATVVDTTAAIDDCVAHAVTTWCAGRKSVLGVG